MIAKLRGKLDEVLENAVILDVNGVGYLVHASSKTLASMPKIDEELVLWVETIVREDSITLYGFSSKADKVWFKLLTTVQGVGAKVGLAILSVADSDSMALAISSEDIAIFTQASGVGKKVATRIVSELKDKVQKLSLAPTVGAKIGNATVLSANTRSISDSASALINLGFGRAEALEAVSKIASESETDLSVSELITQGLSRLSSHAKGV